METNFLNYINEIEAEIITIRRHIHQNPELSFEEYKTSQFIFQKLVEFGLDPKPIGNTGLTAIITNENLTLSDGCIAFRADIDALPIHEETGLPFCSNNNGVMHACGHDVHSSILLGVAKVLSKYRTQLKEPIKLIFQPGEEKLPGGASILIREKVLENPKVKCIYGLHVSPELKVGQIGWRKGIYMASCDEIYVNIIGRGGHGALPQNCIDPIVIGANIITGIQQVISRKADPRTPSVLSFGHFESLGATNVIPDKALLKGTFRTFDEGWRKKAHFWIQSYIQKAAESAGGKVEIQIIKGYPFLKNDALVVDTLIHQIQKTNLGFELVPLDIRMTSEDFSYYSQEVPACFFRLGTSNDSIETQFGVHNSQFLIDEKAIAVGIKAFCSLVL